MANEAVEQQELMESWSRSWCEGGNSNREDHDRPRSSNRMGDIGEGTNRRI
jgi:hypothetical protein